VWINDPELGQEWRNGPKASQAVAHDELIVRKPSIAKFGAALPEIHHWKWGATNAGKPA
jgi:hypothetical protein